MKARWMKKQIPYRAEYKDLPITIRAWNTKSLNNTSKLKHILKSGADVLLLQETWKLKKVYGGPQEQKILHDAQKRLDMEVPCYYAILTDLNSSGSPITVQPKLLNNKKECRRR